ncbi:MAG: T9SS type A sorting domain-containing protein, partial [Fibrobacteres bacterium]|nr:T9SS type A sorting domain-containing protein [Fibrobacterota bacterium]
IWAGNDKHGFSVASGVYFIRMTSGNYSVTRKIVLSR